MLIFENLFTPLFFVLAIFFASIIRKIIMKKFLSVKIDEDLKDLSSKDFFSNILKVEKSSKLFFYVEFFLFFSISLFIIFEIYKKYFKRIEFMEESSNFSISSILFESIEFSIAISFCFILILLLLTLTIKKIENKRISKMLDNLDKFKLLNYAKEDFLNSDRIFKTRLILQSDVKLGKRYLFAIYPAYIIPYAWIGNIEIGKFFTNGGIVFYLDIKIKKSLESIKIKFGKKEDCERVKEFILKNKN